eukprot:7963740-Karenia_brevis.AAC.1
MTRLLSVLCLVYVLCSITIGIATHCRVLAVQSAKSAAQVAGHNMGQILMQKLSMVVFGNTQYVQPDVGIRAAVQMLPKALLMIESRRLCGALASASMPIDIKFCRPFLRRG